MGWGEEGRRALYFTDQWIPNQQQQHMSALKMPMGHGGHPGLIALEGLAVFVPTAEEAWLDGAGRCLNAGTDNTNETRYTHRIKRVYKVLGLVSKESAIFHESLIIVSSSCLCLSFFCSFSFFLFMVVQSCPIYLIPKSPLSFLHFHSPFLPTSKFLNPQPPPSYQTGQNAHISPPKP